jgi:uncharacterized protein (DUF2141 family)
MPMAAGARGSDHPVIPFLETVMKQVLAAVCLAAAPLCSLATEVTLEIEGLDADRLQGATLMVGVYTRPSTWLGRPQVGHRITLTPAAAPGGRYQLVLKNLPTGPLAISLFQDVNGNGRLDMGAMGIPTERYGFSNNVRGQFAPPSFEQALLTPVAGQVLKISMS